MSTKATSWVKQYVSKLADGDIFITRDLLDYGTRSAIDQALSRLVNAAYVRRLTRGVFCKSAWTCNRPLAFDVAWARARNSGKELHASRLPFDAEYGPRLTNWSGKYPTDDVEELIFAACGATGSFMYNGQRIILKGTSCQHQRSEVNSKTMNVQSSPRRV